MDRIKEMDGLLDLGLHKETLAIARDLLSREFVNEYEAAFEKIVPKEMRGEFGL